MIHGLTPFLLRGPYRPMLYLLRDHPGSSHDRAPRHSPLSSSSAFVTLTSHPLPDQEVFTMFHGLTPFSSRMIERPFLFHSHLPRHSFLLPLIPSGSRGIYHDSRTDPFFTFFIAGSSVNPQLCAISHCPGVYPNRPLRRFNVQFNPRYCHRGFGVEFYHVVPVLQRTGGYMVAPCGLCRAGFL